MEVSQWQNCLEGKDQGQRGKGDDSEIEKGGRKEDLVDSDDNEDGEEVNENKGKK